MFQFKSARLAASMAIAAAAFSGWCLAEEMSNDQLIQQAMAAAPASVSADATIQTMDGTLLREGSNGWTCFPGLGPDDDYSMCNDKVWMKWADAYMNKKEFHTDRIGISYMLNGDANTDNEDPFGTDPNNGHVWVQEGPHLMILVPDASMLEGLPTDPDAGGPYVMWKGTPYQHIMVPVGERDE